MAKMTEITCKCGCKRKRLVREADVKRGWGKFYSKSCKATSQEKRTDQYHRYLMRQEKGWRRGEGDSIEDSFHPHDTYSLGQE